MTVKIESIEYILPEGVLTNEDLSKEFPKWSVEKIFDKTGIKKRHIVSKEEFASDLALKAAEKLFSVNGIKREEIDYLLYCTQSPDYYLPSTACILQTQLGLSNSMGAFDFNLGCSGFVYGLGLAKALIETNQASKVLLITSETYTKYIHPGDRSVRTLFGDAAAATLLCGEAGGDVKIGPFVYGTDGSGAGNLIVPAGGLRKPISKETGLERTDSEGILRSENNLYMNGAEVFSFSLQRVPEAVKAILLKAGMTDENVDLYIFHQANKFMLDYLRKKCHIPENKFFMNFQEIGNTVSSTIPIALKDAESGGALKKGMNVVLVGFGVGYSWAACIVKW